MNSANNNLCREFEAEIKNRYECVISYKVIDASYVFNRERAVECPKSVLDVYQLKFKVTEPVSSYVPKCSYQVINPEPNTVNSFYMSAEYTKRTSLLYSDFDGTVVSGEKCTTEWRRYSPGDQIIGQPKVLGEVIELPYAGAVGTTMTIKILRKDIVENLLNILHIERFMSKYAPKKI